MVLFSVAQPERVLVRRKHENSKPKRRSSEVGRKSLLRGVSRSKHTSKERLASYLAGVFI